MSGNWYRDIMKKMDPEELAAIIDVLYSPENKEAVIRLSMTCDTREEAAIVAKNMWGLEYDKSTGKITSGNYKKRK